MKRLDLLGAWTPEYEFPAGVNCVQLYELRRYSHLDEIVPDPRGDPVLLGNAYSLDELGNLVIDSLLHGQDEANKWRPGSNDEDFISAKDAADLCNAWQVRQFCIIELAAPKKDPLGAFQPCYMTPGCHGFFNVLEAEPTCDVCGQGID